MQNNIDITESVIQAQKQAIKAQKELIQLLLSKNLALTEQLSPARTLPRNKKVMCTHLRIVS